ncbi:MAG: flagellar biosynthetic protein FliR [Pseudomonadota bacterium]
MTFSLNLLPELTFVFLLIFARLSAIFMALPGFGEQFLSPRMRLGIALSVSFLMMPLLRTKFGPIPQDIFTLLMLVGHEIVFGLLIGVVIRFIRSSLLTAGAMIAQQIGVGFVTQVDPTQGGQGIILGNFLAMFGIVLVFATDLHHLALAAINDSYTMFPPSGEINFDDMAMSALKSFSSAFVLAIQISAPFLVAGIVFHASIGVLARLMPALPIFFITLPIQILAGFVLFSVLFASIGSWYLAHVDQAFHMFMVQ